MPRRWPPAPTSWRVKHYTGTPWDGTPPPPSGYAERAAFLQRIAELEAEQARLLAALDVSVKLNHLLLDIMSEHNPGDGQKLGEAITAMNSAFRVYVRALLVAIAALLKIPAPELNAALSDAIDGMFVNYRTVLHENLRLNRAIIVEQQNIVGRLEDRVIALEALHKNELAAAGLNSIEAGKP